MWNKHYTEHLSFVKNLNNVVVESIKANIATIIKNGKETEDEQSYILTFPKGNRLCFDFDHTYYHVDTIIVNKKTNQITLDGEDEVDDRMTDTFICDVNKKIANDATIWLYIYEKLIGMIDN